MRATALVAAEQAAVAYISDALFFGALALSAAAYAAAVAEMVTQDSAFAAPLAAPFDG